MTAFLVTLIFWVSVNGTEPARQTVQWDGSLNQCQLFGQAQISQWLGEHPAAKLATDPDTGRAYRCTAEPMGGATA